MAASPALTVAILVTISVIIMGAAMGTGVSHLLRNLILTFYQTGEICAQM